jgi:hypothetical protein
MHKRRLEPSWRASLELELETSCPAGTWLGRQRLKDRETAANLVLVAAASVEAR